MQTKSSLIKISTMWHKVNEFLRNGLSQRQISCLLGVHRDTVRRYQQMSEAEFASELQRETRRHQCKLEPYRGFVVQELQDAPYLSSAQVFDHLKEHFKDFPDVSEKTVYNFVSRIREEENLPKENEPIRQMHKLPECEYGESAQVDYGEKWMLMSNGRRVKVYFFAMILSRSRYKFIYLQNVPFTAKSTVYAHHLAFKYFGGMPQKVLYDQDRKMLVYENYGDYVMTEEFARYVAEAGYEAVFAMPADPQTKGKVENLVRYVKMNFLCGRKYLNIMSLNEQCIGWLSRTGNAKVHSTTKLIPAEVFEEEKKHLLPYTIDMEEPDFEARQYVVRSDNTLLYRSNTYSLPLGTYKGKGTHVLVANNVDGNKLEIYDEADYTLLAEHDICQLKGMHISKEGHTTSQHRDILESEKILRDHLGQWEDGTPLLLLLAQIRENRPRYYRKSVVKMASVLTDYDRSTSATLVDIYLEKKVYNADKMEEIAKSLCNRIEDDKPRPKLQVVSINLSSADIMPEKRKMEEYMDIINGDSSYGTGR